MALKDLEPTCVQEFSVKIEVVCIIYKHTMIGLGIE